MPEASEQEKYTVDKNGIKRRARRTYTDESKQQIVDLYNCSNIFKGLRIICKLQIPPRLKVKICLLTPINNMLKLLIRFLY